MNKQNETVNLILNDMNDLSECAGKVSGVAMILRSTVGNKRNKIDVDYICMQLLDIVDDMEAAIGGIRHTLFPIEDQKAE